MPLCEVRGPGGYDCRIRSASAVCPTFVFTCLRFCLLQITKKVHSTTTTTTRGTDRRSKRHAFAHKTS